MSTEQIIEKWEEKHSSILAEYSKGNANNEVMQLYRSQMKNVLDFIEDIKQVKNNFALADVSGMCEHPWASVLGDGEMQPAKCLKCGKIL